MRSLLSRHRPTAPTMSDAEIEALSREISAELTAAPLRVHALLNQWSKEEGLVESIGRNPFSFPWLIFELIDHCPNVYEPDIINIMLNKDPKWHEVISDYAKEWEEKEDNLWRNLDYLGKFSEEKIPTFLAIMETMLGTIPTVRKASIRELSSMLYCRIESENSVELNNWLRVFHHTYTKECPACYPPHLDEILEFLSKPEFEILEPTAEEIAVRTEKTDRMIEQELRSLRMDVRSTNGGEKIYEVTSRGDDGTPLTERLVLDKSPEAEMRRREEAASQAAREERLSLRRIQIKELERRRQGLPWLHVPSYPPRPPASKPEPKETVPVATLTVSGVALHSPRRQLTSPWGDNRGSTTASCSARTGGSTKIRLEDFLKMSGKSSPTRG